MEQEKKDEIIQKVSDKLEERNYGEGSLSLRLVLTIDNEKEKEVYEISERS